MNWYKFFVRIVFGITLAFVVWLNLQPWFEVGRYLASNVTFIPFERALVSIPLIGGFVSAAKSFTADFFAVIIWIFVQCCQLFGLLASDKALMDAFKSAYGFLPLSGITASHAKKLKSISGLAYLLEAVVCSFVYPIYGNGFPDLIADFPRLDLELFNKGEIVILFLTIICFEVFIWLTCTMWIFMMGEKKAPTKSAAPSDAGRRPGFPG